MANYAFIVAINEYPALTKLNTLKGAVADAVDFAEWALDQNGGNVDQANFQFWTDDVPDGCGPLLHAALQNRPPWPAEITPDLNQPPNSNRIIDCAKALAEQARESAGDARLYLFFAGHGVRVNDRSYERDPQNCFVASNYEPGSSRGLVPLGDLLRMLEWHGPEEIIIFQDCCRSDMPFNQDAPKLGLNIYNPHEVNRQWVSGNAARGNGTAFEVPHAAPARGAYTKILVQALRQFRPAGGLRASALRGFLSNGVTQLVKPKEQQTELKMRSDEDDCILIDGPVIGAHPIVHIEVESAISDGHIALLDQDRKPVFRFPASDGAGEIQVPVGRYEIAHEESGKSTQLFHVGPEVTNVSI